LQRPALGNDFVMGGRPPENLTGWDFQTETSPDVEAGKHPHGIAGADDQPMAFSGLWEGFRWPDGTVARTFTIITTDANATMSELHDRMPVAEEQWDDTRCNDLVISLVV